MKTIGKIALLAATILTSACQSEFSDLSKTEELQPADFVFNFDMSQSSLNSSDRDYAAALGQRLQRELLAENPQLGDRVVTIKFGDRGPQNFVSNAVRLSRQHGAKPVAQALGQFVAGLPDSPDAGQQSTNILFPLLNGDFRCTPGRGGIWIVSDMVSTGIDFDDVQGLLDGTAEIPVPQGAPLKSCRITVIGIGALADDAGQLSSQQILNLIAVWQRFFISAGVSPADLRFMTTLSKETR